MHNKFWMIDKKPILNLYYRLFPRTLKEWVKNILFGAFPFLFKHWKVYQNWKYGKVFRSKGIRIWQKQFCLRKFGTSYQIKLNPSDKSVGNKGGTQKLAVVVHVFYPEIFREILQMLQKQNTPEISLYITGTGRVLSEISSLIASEKFSSVNYLEVENRGRDIWPFIKILPMVFKDGHEIVLKLHTKGSNHLNRKEHWRNQLFSNLIGKGKMEKVLTIFQSNSAIGMVGPAGNILPMSLYYAANGRKVVNLAYRMGLKAERLSDLNFVAGSMFYARREVLLPVLKLSLSENDFEPEAAQTDGTLAHAVERAFAAGLLGSGMQLADTNYSDEKPVLRVNKTNKNII